MKMLLLILILFALAIVAPIPAMGRVDRDTVISQPPAIVLEARPEVIMAPDTGVLLVADSDADTPKESPTGGVKKQEGEFTEKGKPLESEEKSDWKINVWPVQPPDSVKSLPKMKDEDNHTPPDRP